MYILYATPANHLAIADLSLPDNVLHLPNADALLHLRARINAFIDTLQLDPTPPDAGPDPSLLTTTDAHRIAQERGYDIPTSTLINAIVNRRIPGAHKTGARWLMSDSSFRAWLDRYTPRT